MNERNPDSPVGPEKAPEHGPDFWNRLDAAIQDDRTAPFEAASLAAANATSQMPRVNTIDRATMAATAQQPVREPSRARWPLAAAAVALVVVGLGYFAIQQTSDPTTTTEIVSAPDAGADASSGDGSGSDDTSNATNPPAVEPANDGDATASSDAAPAGDAPSIADADTVAGATAEPDAATSDTASTTTSDGQDGAGDITSDGDPDSVEVVATPVPVPPIPDFASARGAVGDPEYLPLDGGIAADSTYLANWSDSRLTWYAQTDPATSCSDAGHSEVLYVNRSGITQQMHDPQLRFSGEISHFVVNSEQDLAAWVVACGSQLELFVATLEPTGRIAELTLAWLGEGSTSSALVLWDTDEVSLNAIEPDAAAFAIAYNVETGLLSRNGGPPRIMLEEGAPAERSLTPIAASPDGGLTYWTGKAPAGTLSACKELYGSGQSDTLWLRQGEGQWRLAAAGDFPLGTVTAAALDSDRLRLAFADVCPGESGRLTVGTQLADGRIGDLSEIDLTPYVPGYVAQLFWVDDATLRIETDNTEFGFGTVRFDYRLDQDLIVQLD